MSSSLFFISSVQLQIHIFGLKVMATKLSFWNIKLSGQGNPLRSRTNTNLRQRVPQVLPEAHDPVRLPQETWGTGDKSHAIPRVLRWDRRGHTVEAWAGLDCTTKNYKSAITADFNMLLSATVRSGKRKSSKVVEKLNHTLIQWQIKEPQYPPIRECIFSHAHDYIYQNWSY